MIQRLFVYGTLGPGRPNEHVLGDIGGTWEPATVRGILYEKGWGAEMGYPGIVLSRQGSEVHGFLFTSEHLIDHWTRLDAFEGSAYRRVVAKATLRDNTKADAYIYELKDA